MGYRFTLGDDEDQLAPPAPMGAGIAAAPQTAEATVPAVIGGFDKFVEGYNAADAQRQRVRDLVGGAGFDPDVLAQARKTLASGLTAGADDDPDVMRKDPVTGKLVSTKPSWYKGNKAPTDPNMPLNAIGVGLSSIGAGKQAQADALAQNPYRNVGNKMLDQSRATSANTLGALASYFGNVTAKNEDRQLDHAAKEAQMYRTLNPSRAGARGSAVQTAADVLRLERDRVNQQMAGEREGRYAVKDAAGRQLESDKNDPAVALAKRAQDILVKAGLKSPEDAAAMSSEDIKRFLPTLNQQQQQRFTLGMKELDYELDNKKKYDDEQSAQMIKWTEDQNKRYQDISDQVIQGGTFDKLATPRAHNEVQGIIDNQQTLVHSAQTVKDLRKKLAEKWGSVEAGIAFLGKKDVALNEEDAGLLRAINGAQSMMDGAYSSLLKYGVPSGMEFKRTGQLSGKEGLAALLFPDAFYDAVQTEANDIGTRQANVRGWYSDKQPEAAAAKERLNTPAQRGVSEYQRSSGADTVRNSSAAVEAGASPRQQTAPANENPAPAVIAPGGPKAPPTSANETEVNSRGKVMPTEGALRAQAGDAALPVAPVAKQEVFTPPAPIKPAAAPAAAGGLVEVTINGKPWKGTQEKLDQIKKLDPSAKIEAKQ